MISEAVERSKAQKARADQTPPPSEWKKQFGDKCKLSPDGTSFELTVRDDKDIRKAHEMQEGSRKIEVEEGAKQQAMMARERVIRRDGRMVEFPEELVDHVKHRFKGGAGRHGKAPTQYYSLGDASRRYKMGPDGLWFVWNEGWEPVELWREGATGPQHDPDGNVWVEVNGEWKLTDEVT